MNKVIKSEYISFDHNEIKSMLEKASLDKSIHISQLVFYPYFYFEYKLERKSLFHPNGGTIGCTVDGINKVGAIVDMHPTFEEQEIQSKTIIPKKLTLVDAKLVAEKFVYDTISFKMKVLSTPQIVLITQMMFYRPYWIVEGNKYAQNKFMLTVDAVTGKYHPL